MGLSQAAESFRFNAEDHSYWIGKNHVPSITQMLEQAGEINSDWYTEESSARGTAVHDLTAAYDLGALSLAGCVSPYRGYLLGHAAAMAMLRPTFVGVEEPDVHQRLRFGGRPDRVGRFYGLRGVLEGKSGQEEKSHSLQTALQAILVAPRLNLPPEMVARFVIYWRENGRFKMFQHREVRDFGKAREIIKACCR